VEEPLGQSHSGDFEPSLELRQPLVRRVARPNLQTEPGKLEQGEERAVLAVGAGTAFEPGVRLLEELFAERLHQTRLSDPGLACDQHRLSVAHGCLLPAAFQQHALPVAPNERGEFRRAGHIEAAPHARRRQRPAVVETKMVDFRRNESGVYPSCSSDSFS
jgi:hypothetical protein